MNNRGTGNVRARIISSSKDSSSNNQMPKLKTHHEFPHGGNNASTGSGEGINLISVSQQQRRVGNAQLSAANTGATGATYNVNYNPNTNYPSQSKQSELHKS